MLVDANRVRAMELLYQTNLLAAVLPEVLPLVGARAESNDRSTGDLWQHALAMLAVLPPEPSLALVLAVLLHDVAPVSHVAGAADRGVEVAVEVGRRWRLPRKEEQRVAWLIAHQASLTDAAGQPWSRLQPLLTAPGIHDLVELVAAMARNGCAAREDVSHVRQLLRLPAEQLNPPPLLTGRDLSEMGLTPGPLFKQILDRVRDAQLDGALGSPSEARAWVAAFMGTPEDDPLSGA